MQSARQILSLLSMEEWEGGSQMVAETQKMSPSTTGSGDSQPMGEWHSDMAANHTDLLYSGIVRGSLHRIVTRNFLA